MDTIIRKLSRRIVARRQAGFPEDDTVFNHACDDETSDLMILSTRAATGPVDIREKAAALMVTPFYTNGMTDSPAPGEHDLLVSIMNDLTAKA